nr:hypothetical protein [Leptospira kirschneri]
MLKHLLNTVLSLATGQGPDSDRRTQMAFAAVSQSNAPTDLLAISFG